MEMHFATVWESIADAIGDAPAVVQGERRYDWTSFEEESARFAGFLRAHGIGGRATEPGVSQPKVGLYLYNSPEYLTAQFGALKERCVPINVNYRYLDAELAYLIDNADLDVLVYHASLADRVDRVKAASPNVRLWVEVDDIPGSTALHGSMPWADAVSSDPADRIRRSEDDHYMLYTGGTTGMPKGVMYDMGSFCGGLLLGYPVVAQMPPPPTASAIAPTVVELRARLGKLPVSVPACPLMHGTGIWIGGFMPQHLGACVVLLTDRGFDADELFRAVEREHVGMTTIVGDAFAKPMLRSLDAAVERGAAFDTSPLRFILSAGVMWSTEVKQRLLQHGDFVLADLLGSSEGSMGSTITTRETLAAKSTETAAFGASPTTKVFIENAASWREVVPGSGEIGMVAAGGSVPLGYYKDEAKSERTFRIVEGVRYSFPGDMAQVRADGSLLLLGRGSNCINTAGEKVFPEEVEEAVKRHGAVLDCLVVGLPDEKFGERVVAVVSLATTTTVDGSALIAHVKSQLAGYKAPKQIVMVETVRRAPNGKADYAWAKETARANVV